MKTALNCSLILCLAAGLFAFPSCGPVYPPAHSRQVEETPSILGVFSPILSAPNKNRDQ